MDLEQQHLSETITPHPDFLRLVRRIQKLPVKRSRAKMVLYRASEPKYARQGDRLMGVGACMHGGRWNPIGLRAVYGSPTPEIAMAESLGIYRHYGLPIHSAMPKEFFAFETGPLKVLNLADGVVRQKLRVSKKRLRLCDWRQAQTDHQEALTQAIGRAAFVLGYESLQAPSARAAADGLNVAIFTEQPGVTKKLKTLRPERL